MPALTNFEIPNFIDIYSRNNLPKIKMGHI